MSPRQNHKLYDADPSKGQNRSRPLTGATSRTWGPPPRPSATLSPRRWKDHRAHRRAENRFSLPPEGIGTRISAVTTQSAKRAKDRSPWRKPWVNWHPNEPEPRKGRKKSRLELAAESFSSSVDAMGWGCGVAAPTASFAPLGLGELQGDLSAHSSRYGLRSFARYTGSLPQGAYSSAYPHRRGWPRDEAGPTPAERTSSNGNDVGFGAQAGEGSFPNARDPSRNLLPELSNFCYLPGRVESPNGQASSGKTFLMLVDVPVARKFWYAICT
jgi:hypothetical protein